jgi:hypothetical protein
MAINKIQLPAQVWQEVSLMRRRIEFLEQLYSLDCFEKPDDWIPHLREIYSDVATDTRTFSERLAEIQVEA